MALSETHVPSQAALEAVHCTHCGLPVPEGLIVGDREGPQFCCNGCRAVYQIMSDNGLGGFYGLRDRTGGAPRGVAVDEESLAGADAYAHYDDPTFIDAHTRAHTEGQRTIDLYADGVHCAACVWVMERLPQVMPGVDTASLSLADQRLRLSWWPEQVSLGQIGGFLHRLGYATHPLGEAADAARKAARRGTLIRLAVAFALAGNTMLLAAALYAGEGTLDPTMARFFEWLSFGLAIPAVTYGAWPFYRGALSGLRMGRPHMDLPVSLGLLGGFFASAYATITHQGHVYFDSVTVLVFLLLLGRYVQSRGQQAAMTGTELMTALTPGTAWRRIEFDGALEFRPASVNTLVAGDVVRVRAGETCPVDGKIHIGETHVDASLLTGESRPVPVGPGAPVYAGTVNIDDEVLIEVQASGASTRLGRLAALVDQADPHRAPVVRLSDRIAGIFVSVVIGLAVAGGVAWSFIDAERIFDVVVSLLVVSCPCALGLATPVALAVARGRAARSGILIRSTTALERLVRVQQVVLDKTGTLTEGQLTVSGAHWSPHVEPAHLCASIEALERRSSHPVARAVAQWAGQHAGLSSTLQVTDVQEQPSKGIAGRIEDRHIIVGRLGWAEGDKTLPPDLHTAADQALRAGHSVVLVVCEGEPVGVLVMSDQIRQDTPAALSRLRALGLGLSVQSGDHPHVVAEIARRLEIDQATGAASPEDKAAAVTESPHVAMIGDGINDAPALRQAEVGIAVAGGAEAALQVADVYLTRPGLDTVADVFEGAHRTFAIIRRNLVFSLLYNVLFASLALAGEITPLAAAVLMPISSLTVVASSVFGRTWRPHREHRS
ncbi:MAG: heavy metal translocating P-type ATPase [Bradymonadia bacterium]